MGQPDVTDADIQLETYIRQQCLRHGTYSTDNIRSLLATHRTAAVAKREKEIVGIARAMAEEFQNSDSYGAGYSAYSLRELIAKIQTGGGA